MKIGMVVFSYTGNTLAVAERLKKKLEKDGHQAVLEQLTVKGRYSPGMPAVAFEKLPDLGKYEALVLGAPVNAFSLCKAMKQYLRRLGRIDGKKVVCLSTQFFPYKWLGGSRALRHMKNACEAAGGTVVGASVVNWGRRNREERIKATVNELSACF